MFFPALFWLLAADPGSPMILDIFLVALGVIGAIIELRRIISHTPNTELISRMAVVENATAQLQFSVS